MASSIFGVYSSVLAPYAYIYVIVVGSWLHRRLWRENLSTAEIGGLVANSKQPKQIVYSV